MNLLASQAEVFSLKVLGFSGRPAKSGAESRFHPEKEILRTENRKRGSKDKNPDPKFTPQAREQRSSMKRVVLFVVTNLAILVLLGIVSSLLQGYLAEQGFEFERMGLLVFAGVFGMGGSFISLAISKMLM